MSETEKPMGVVVTPEFRMIFPNLFEARAVKVKGKDSGDPKYGLLMLFDPSDVKPLKVAAAQVAAAKWPGRDLKELHFGFKSGDRMAQERAAKKKDGSFYAGTVVLKASSKFKPDVIDKAGQQVIDPKKAYSGCYGYAELNFVAYDGVGNNPDGVTAYVNFVMVSRDGEKVAVRDAKDVFADHIGKSTDEDPTTGALDDDIPF